MCGKLLMAATGVEDIMGTGCDIKQPLRGSKNQMMIRFDAQMSYDIEDDTTQWERTTLVLVRAQVELLLNKSICL